ncbi:unnamed protein product, partial [Staurois parvus]
AGTGVSKVSLGGIVPQHWCHCNDEALFLPLTPMMGHYSLVSVGGIVSHHWCVSGRNSAPSLVSVGGIVPHHWCQWEE